MKTHHQSSNMSDNFLQNLDPNMLKLRFNLSEEELESIRQIGTEAKRHLDIFIEDMYKWMPSLREFRKFFPTDSIIPHVKAQQKGYWQIFFNGRLDQDYVRNRTTIGFTHARINLPINTYCVGMNFSIEWWLSKLGSFATSGQDLNFLNQAFRKMCCLDIALITESYSQLMNEKVKTLLDETNATLDKVTMVAESIAIGDFSQGYKSSGDQDKRLSNAINQMTDNLKEVVKQTKVIAQGKYDVEFAPLSEKDELGKSVSEMTKALREMSNESKKSAWIKTGQAELSNIMRGDQDLRELGKNIISFLAKYSGGLVGTIYHVDFTQQNTLEIIGSFAYHRRKGDRSKIKFGEGLVGQCALEKEMIVFSNVPDEYTAINSSLGEIVPKSILVIPLLIQKELIGVIELGAYDIFDNTKMELLKQVSENIAIALKSSQNSDKMKRLFEDSKRQSEELQSQQEELRCTNEELQSQQEMLRKSNEDLERHTAILKKSEEEIKYKNEELKEKTKYLEKQSSDISEKSQLLEKAKSELEQRAKELEIASKYKSEFLANMSHELRTPLNSLLILSKSLSENEEGNLTSEQIESSKVIYRGGQDLLNLINDILDLSKVEAGKLQIYMDHVSIQSIMDNLRSQFTPISNSKGLLFKHEISEVLRPTIKTDGQRAEQILKNFLSNAFKFTQKGSVCLKIHPPQKGIKFRLPHLSESNCVGFSVIDTGIGITKDKQDVIFEAFHQGDGSTNRQYGGTGLGLSISKELARILGGEIKLISEPGKGSTFTLYLPHQHEAHDSEIKKKSFDDYIAKGIQLNVQESPKNTSRTTPSPAILDDQNQLQAHDKILLIIEDDAKFAQILMGFARKRNFKCVIAPNGTTGLEYAEKYKPHGITLDLKLPDIEGRSILDCLKSNPRTSHIPVHVISLDDNELLSLEKGAVGHLTKPITMEGMENALANIERIHQKTIKKVLVIEDTPTEQKAITQTIKNENIAITLADTGYKALDYIQTMVFDCAILDLQLPDMSGLELLKKLKKLPSVKLPPVIVYTCREMTKEEYNELNEYTSSFIIKGVSSKERLLDELYLFLHRIEPNKEEVYPDTNVHGLFTLENRKILLVDDDMRNIFALSSMLKKKGLKIILADNGRMALEKLEAEPDIELVIMDIMMPIMDGYEAIEKIRQQEKFAEIPIIALTAKILPEDKNKALNAGANDFQTKPVDVDKLLSLIKVWLSNSKNSLTRRNYAPMA